jgi:D-alanine-D-alanine ligase
MKKTIALITGGYTGEYVISLKSAETVNKFLNKDKYKVYKIIITKEVWGYKDDKDVSHEVNRHDFSLNIDGQKITFDAAFICLHGSPGEDGKLQSYFDLLNIPYNTCDALTSALTMNKVFTKAVVNGIPDVFMADAIQFSYKNKEEVDRITNKLHLPYFVKTNTGGSSIGMSKVKTMDELPAALEKAFNEDNELIIEEFIDGREFSIGVYRNKQGIQVLPATEIIPSGEFFDFDAKYTPGATQEITPGRMNQEEIQRVEKIVREIYEKLNCKGVVRVDYFLQKETGKFYFIEINTVPGQTETSFIPQQVRAANLTLEKFYDELLEMII